MKIPVDFSAHAVHGLSRVSWRSWLQPQAVPANTARLDVGLNPRLILGALLAITALLAAGHLAVQVAAFYLDIPYVYQGSRIYRFFDLAAEANLPTWYQGLALFTTAMLLALVALASFLQRLLFHAAYWLMLALGFLFLSFDELTQVHEALVKPVRRLMDIDGGLLTIGWVVPGAIAVGLVFVGFIPFLRSLPRATAIRFFVAGAIYVGGAIVLEAIGHATLPEDGERTFFFKMLAMFEEVAEKAGVAFFLYAILLYLGDHPISLHLGGAPKEGGSV